MKMLGNQKRHEDILRNIDIPLFVGTKNYYPNSSAIVTNSGTTLFIVTAGVLDEMVGSDCVISFEIKRNKEISYNVVSFYHYQSSGIGIKFEVSKHNVPLTDDWVRVSFTGKVVSNPVPPGYFNGSMILFNQYGVTGDYSVRNVQILKGIFDSEYREGATS